MEFVELVCSPNLQRLTNVLEVNEKNRFLDNLAEMEFVLTKELGCIPNLQILTNVLEENSSLTKLSLENQLDEDTQKKKQYGTLLKCLLDQPINELCICKCKFKKKHWICIRDAVSLKSIQIFRIKDCIIEDEMLGMILETLRKSWQENRLKLLEVRFPSQVIYSKTILSIREILQMGDLSCLILGGGTVEKKFFKIMETNLKRSLDTLTEFYLENMKLPKPLKKADRRSFGKMVEVLLNQVGITTISLRGNRFFSEIDMENLSHLVNLDLSFCGDFNPNAIQNIANAVETSATLQFLNLSYISLTEPTSEHMVRALTSLGSSFSSNYSLTNLGVRGIFNQYQLLQEFCESMSSNSSIVTLDLSNTDLSEPNFDLVKSMIARNTSITTLSLLTCHLTVVNMLLAMNQETAWPLHNLHLTLRDLRRVRVDRAGLPTESMCKSFRLFDEADVEFDWKTITLPRKKGEPRIKIEVSNQNVLPTQKVPTELRRNCFYLEWIPQIEQEQLNSGFDGCGFHHDLIASRCELNKITQKLVLNSEHTLQLSLKLNLVNLNILANLVKNNSSVVSVEISNSKVFRAEKLMAVLEGKRNILTYELVNISDQKDLERFGKLVRTNDSIVEQKDLERFGKLVTTNDSIVRLKFSNCDLNWEMLSSALTVNGVVCFAGLELLMEAVSSNTTIILDRLVVGCPVGSVGWDDG
jgi:hypothetical protein